MRLIQGDCLEEMDKLIAEGVKVDAVITDPPYGTTACKWDTVIPFDEMWERLNKLIKPNGAIVLFGSEPFSSALRMSNIKNYKYDWIWDKALAVGFLRAKYKPLQRTEQISVFSTGCCTYTKKGNAMPYFPVMEKRESVRKFNNTDHKNNGVFHTASLRSDYKRKDYTHRYPVNIIKISNANHTNKLHPTQKPVALMEYLVKTYTNEGDTVLDFTMGSGSTGVACNNTNRHFIGIEKDEKYFKIAQERIL